MPALFDLDARQWATLRSLLDDALALAPAKRPAWLGSLAADFAPLKPRLQQLLSHAEAKLLDTLPKLEPEALRWPGGTDGELAAADEADGAAPSLPPKIGPYRALRLLGEGGMGRVWLAERVDIMRGRPVALKLPHAAWRHPGLAQRMAREREILAVLDHSHIARLIDAGVAPDGQPYLALEYVEGLRIDHFAQQAELGVRERLGLFLQVVRAVAHAHSRLVVHRDLKPGNILVTPAGEVRLLDFGIARLIAPQAGEGGAGAEATALTQHGARLLTPQYAAPEQLRGEPVGTATDIHALGVVLFELLTGARPYRLMRGSAAELEEAILHREPLRLSASVADHKLRRTLQGDLDTIVAKAMKKLPAERYATAQALAEDIERWLAQRPVRARPDSLLYRSGRFLQRHRLGVALSAALSLAAAGGLVHTLRQAEQVRLEAARATAVKDFLVSLFEASDVDLRDGAQRRQQSVQQLLEQSATALSQGNSFQAQPELRSELLALLAGLMRNLGLADGAAALRQQRAALLLRVGADALAQAQALRDIAQLQRDRSAWPDARATLARAVAHCEHNGTPRAEVCLGLQIDLASIDTAERHIAPALQRLEPLLPLLRKASAAPRQAAAASTPPAGTGTGTPTSEGPPGLRAELATALELLGLLRALSNQPEAAQPLLQEALAMRRAEWGADSVRLANLRYRLGRNLWVMRHLALATTELRAAAATFDRAFGADHPRSARVALSLGRLEFYVGVVPDGLAKLRRASALLLQQVPPLPPAEQLDARVVLANALLLDGRLAEAGPALQSAIALRSSLGESAYVDPTLDQSQGRWLMDTGRHAEAKRWLAQSIARATALYGAGHPEVADRRLRVAQVGIAERQFEQAAGEIDAVLASQDAREAAFGSVKHRAVLARAAMLLEQGRFDEARPLVDAAWQAASQRPRADLYRDLLHNLHEQRARTLQGLGDTTQAARHFEQAIALLAGGHDANPYLAATRARYASLLLQQHDTAAAKQQLSLAERALREQPEAGEQFRRPLRQARQQLRQREPSPADRT